MIDAKVEFCIAAFGRRSAATMLPGQVPVDVPGMLGLVGATADDPPGALLITDDRALDALAGGLPFARLIRVLPAAARCASRLIESGEYDIELATVMFREHLDGLPDPVPAGLTLRPVSTSADDGIDGVPLAEAVATVIGADPAIPPWMTVDRLAGRLRSLAGASFYAAVDADGAVRATSAAVTFGADAEVFFVSTDPAWRGRGIATAMTAAALRAAAEAGARQACLDASAAGRPIYERLGFEPVTPVSRFSRRR